MTLLGAIHKILHSPEKMVSHCYKSEVRYGYSFLIVTKVEITFI